MEACSDRSCSGDGLKPAFVALGEPTLSIDVILCDVSALGSQSGFELARWVRTNRPALEVRLERAASRRKAQPDMLAAPPNL